MSYDTIARRYARAIFELAKEAGNQAAVADLVSAFAEVYSESAELRHVIENPLVDQPARIAVVADVMQLLGRKSSSTAAADLVNRSMHIITRARRLRAVPDIARHLRRMVDEDGRILRAKVTTAAATSSSYLDRLKSEIERATGQKVVLTHEVDPSLIGGVITAIGDRVVDGSLRSRLLGLRDISL